VPYDFNGPVQLFVNGAALLDTGAVNTPRFARYVATELLVPEPSNGGSYLHFVHSGLAAPNGSGTLTTIKEEQEDDLKEFVDSPFREIKMESDSDDNGDEDGAVNRVETEEMFTACSATSESDSNFTGFTFVFGCDADNDGEDDGEDDGAVNRLDIDETMEETREWWRS
jgi:hypothetical protein